MILEPWGSPSPQIMLHSFQTSHATTALWRKKRSHSPWRTSTWIHTSDALIKPLCSHAVQDEKATDHRHGHSSCWNYSDRLLWTTQLLKKKLIEMCLYSSTGQKLQNLSPGWMSHTSDKAAQEGLHHLVLHWGLLELFRCCCIPGLGCPTASFLVFDMTLVIVLRVLQNNSGILLSRLLLIPTQIKSHLLVPFLKYCLLVGHSSVDFNG